MADFAFDEIPIMALAGRTSPWPDAAMQPDAHRYRPETKLARFGRLIWVSIGLLLGATTIALAAFQLLHLND